MVAPGVLEMLLHCSRKTAAPPPPLELGHRMSAVWVQASNTALPGTPSGATGVLENVLLYLFFMNLSFLLSEENNLCAKSILVSDIILLIHLLHLCNIEMCLILLKLLTQITVKQESVCNQTQVWLLAAHKPTVQEASVSRNERCFNQKSRQPGRRWTRVLRPTLKILLSNDNF